MLEAEVLLVVLRTQVHSRVGDGCTASVLCPAECPAGPGSAQHSLLAGIAAFGGSFCDVQTHCGYAETP